LLINLVELLVKSPNIILLASFASISPYIKKWPCWEEIGKGIILASENCLFRKDGNRDKGIGISDKENLGNESGDFGANNGISKLKSSG